MKRILTLALAGVLSLSLVACGEKPDANVDPVPSPDITAAPSESAPVESEKPGDVIATTTDAPAPSTAPVESEKPAESEKPEESPKPSESAKPSENPAESENPVTSSAPSAAPAESESPAESEEPVAEFDPQTVYSDVLSAGASSQYDASSMLSVFYDLTAADLEWFRLGMPSMSSNIEEIFVAHAKDGKLDTVKSACQTRLEDLKSDAETYPETGSYVANAQIVTVGNWVMLYVGPNASTAVKSFQDALIVVCG